MSKVFHFIIYIEYTARFNFDFILQTQSSTTLAINLAIKKSCTQLATLKDT